MISQTDTMTKKSGSIWRQIAIAMILCQSIILFSCNTMEKQDAIEKTRVIFDTDIGADIDDALALAMLYNYMDLGWIDMLAVMSCKDHPYSARYIDVMNIWYGYPDMPIGIVIDGVKHDTSVYTRHVVEMKKDGKPVFVRSLQEGQKPPVAVSLYRKLLSASPDHSVVIIAVGQSTNLARLIDSEPDEYSPLPGLELVSRKVDYLSIMAGNFRESVLRQIFSMTVLRQQRFSIPGRPKYGSVPLMLDGHVHIRERASRMISAGLAFIHLWRPTKTISPCLTTGRHGT